MAGRFPEIEQAAAALSEDAVLGGEILAWTGGGSLPFSRPRDPTPADADDLATIQQRLPPSA